MIETSVQSHPFSATRNLLQSSAKEPSPPPAASPHIHSRVEFEEASLTFALLDLLALLVDLLLAMSDRTDANAQRVSTLPPDGDDDSTSTVSDMVEVPFATAVLIEDAAVPKKKKKKKKDAPSPDAAAAEAEAEAAAATTAATVERTPSQDLPSSLDYKDQGRNMSEFSLGVGSVSSVPPARAPPSTRSSSAGRASATQGRDLPSSLAYKDLGRNMESYFADATSANHDNDGTLAQPNAHPHRETQPLRFGAHSLDPQTTSTAASRERFWKRLTVSAVVLLLFGAGLGVGISMMTRSSSEDSSTTAAETADENGGNAGTTTSPTPAAPNSLPTTAPLPTRMPSPFLPSNRPSTIPPTTAPAPCTYIDTLDDFKPMPMNPLHLMCVCTLLFVPLAWQFSMVSGNNGALTWMESLQVTCLAFLWPCRQMAMCWLQVLG
jgi:hypothetical protein